MILAVVLIAHYILVEWLAPLPFYSMKYDPEMPYFMNSLALIKGVPYGYIDHPGTPLEVLGTIMLALTRPWTRSSGVLFIPYHLENPQVFLTIAHGFLSLASVVCVLQLAGRSVEDRSPRGILASCAVAVAFYTIDPVAAFRTLTTWSHNSFTFPFGTLLLLGMVVRLRKDETVAPGTALIVGGLAGLLSTVQLYFLAWGLGVVAAIALYTGLRGEGWWAAGRKAAAAVTGVGLGLFVGFAPVIHRFREFYLWVDRLLFHQGRYGSGPEGVTTPGVSLDHLESLSRQSPWAFVASAGIVALVLLAMRIRRKRAREDAAWWASCLALLLQLGLVWAAIGKHPGAVYLLAVAAILPVLLALALETFLQAGGRWAALGTLSAALILTTFAAGWVLSGVEHLRRVRQVSLAEAVIDREIRAYAERSGENREQMDIVWGYGVPSRCFALRFGDLFTGMSLQSEIDSLCDHEWLYEVWGEGYVRLSKTYEPLAVNTEWDIVIVPDRYRPAVSGRVGQILDTGVESEGYGNILIVTPSERPAGP